MENLVNQCAARLIGRLVDLKREIQTRRLRTSREELEEDMIEIECEIDALCQKLAEFV
jgi:hypothetical protein